MAWHGTRRGAWQTQTTGHRRLRTEPVSPSHRGSPRAKTSPSSIDSEPRPFSPRPSPQPHRGMTPEYPPRNNWLAHPLPCFTPPLACLLVPVAYQGGLSPREMSSQASAPPPPTPTPQLSSFFVRVFPPGLRVTFFLRHIRTRRSDALGSRPDAGKFPSHMTTPVPSQTKSMVDAVCVCAGRQTSRALSANWSAPARMSTTSI
ncbi:hypothetical protein B0I35DRAFT_86657 [Stachybotrys elegans]|uniref:Uncharacterized protein n=1 Tax=Stachybotrys elegans TaxID=80388 RepID=A0A8K0SJM2_9HYPO|nr:hypothetical protein B0I35DRAFT_86657 [Stachybotrys elegans]